MKKSLPLLLSFFFMSAFLVDLSAQTPTLTVRAATAGYTPGAPTAFLFRLKVQGNPNTGTPDGCKGKWEVIATASTGEVITFYIEVSTRNGTQEGTATVSFTAPLSGDFTVSACAYLATCEASPVCTELPTPLPIHLLYFKGKQVGNAVELRWETASEHNNTYMEVQRSKDGINFIPLHKEKGQGYSSTITPYSWTDLAPMAGLNYYRLKQVDADSKYEYHRIAAVDFKGKTSEEGIRLYPTEVKDHINIVLNAPTSAEATLYVLDLTGRILQRQAIAAGSVQEQVQLPNLPQGQYFITLRTENTVKTARFIKL